MRELEQQGAAGAEEDDGFPVDPPRHRRRTEDALRGTGSLGPDDFESRAEIAFRDQSAKSSATGSQTDGPSRDDVIKLIPRVGKAKRGQRQGDRACSVPIVSEQQIIV
jgi:hypothetical protein